MTKDTNGRRTVDERIKDFAHEIRSPLGVLVGYGKMVAEAGKRELTIEQVEEYGGAIHAAAIRVGRVCERILEEETAGSAVIRKERVDFRQVTENMVQAFSPAARERGVNLKVDIDDNFPVLQADPVLLEQIISNLVTNAIKFTKRGGTVEMRGKLDVANRAVMLVIQDDGKGIPSHLLMRLMQGERVSTQTKGLDKGWGRGIQIVRDIADKMNAKIDIASEPGRGTVVSLRLAADESG